MFNYYKKYYQIFLSHPAINGRECAREITAAYLYVLLDYILLSNGEHITRQETAQEIFNLLETKILSNEELKRFDKVVDLFGKVIREEVAIRGDWWLGNKEKTNELQRVFWCYGDLIYAPYYIEDYEHSPILICPISFAMEFGLKFMEIRELSLKFITDFNDEFINEQKKEDNDKEVLSDIFAQLKKILIPVKVDDEFLKENIEFCYGNMSEGTKILLKNLLRDYNTNYSALSVKQDKFIEILWKIANIFHEDGFVHKPNYAEINGQRISFQHKVYLYTAIMLYEKIALMGDYNAYIKAATWCEDMGYYHIEERKIKKKEYYNRAAEKGVLKAYRYCDYMPEVFDILIKEKGPKHYIAYFFTYYRRMEYWQCKKYLDFIKQQCTEEEKAEVINEISVNSYEADVLAVKYLNGEIDDYKIKKENHGCYIATCVYGSYDCPEVWTLRRYRDNTLGSTWYGRAFIKLYYAISPSLVKCFGHTRWFKKMWKRKLDKIVERLNRCGVDNTLYQDKEWE